MPSFLPWITYVVFHEVLLSYLIARRSYGIPRSNPLIVFGFLVCVAVNVYALSCSRVTGDALLDYAIGSTSANNICTAALFLFLSRADDELRHRSNNFQSINNTTIFYRMYLAMWLQSNVRSVGWYGEPKRLPPPPTNSRVSFVLSRLAFCALSLLALDTSQTILFLWPPVRSSLFNAGTIAWLVRPYAFLSLCYDALAVGAVSIGASEPRDWPRFFGNWKEAYSVKGLWGYVWHQEMRRFVAPMARAVVSFLNLQPSSKIYYILQLLVAFSVSGVIHCFGDATLGVKYIGRSFIFFFIQAFPIAVEASISWDSLVRSRRLLGYVWVVTWFWMTVPLFTWQIEEGFARAFAPFPCSLTAHLVRILSGQ